MTRRDLFLLSVTVAALLTVIVPLAINVHVLDYDEAVFMDVARNIQRYGLPFRSLGAQGQPAFEHTPLYLYVLSIYAQGSDAGVFGARLVTLAFGIASVWLTFEIGRRIGGPIAGSAAALILAVNAFFGLHAFFIRMEVPMVCAMLAGLLLLVVSEHGQRIGRILAAGVLLALAALFKQFAILFTCWCAIFVILDCRRNRRGVARALLALAIPSVVAAILWVAWGWRISPIAFTAAWQRWLNSIGAVSLFDPRASVTARQWAEQLSFDLFGLAVIVGLVASLIALRSRRRADLSAVHLILWGYLLSALALSFLVRLKELRHLIGVLPVAALIIGTSIDWAGLGQRIRTSRGWLPKAGYIAALLLLLLWASPLRFPVGPLNDAASWLDTPYGRRLLDNDRFYNVLRLTGRYLQEHTAPDEVITVAHQAPVTAYYADRRHNMLYTLPKAVVDSLLKQTGVLVWDDETFLAMTPAEVAALRNEVNARFKVVEVIRDGPRMVTILR